MNLWLPVGEGSGEGIVREFGINVYTPIFKMDNQQGLLYSTGNSAQYHVAAWIGEEFGGEWIHVYVQLSFFAVHLKL